MTSPQVILVDENDQVLGSEEKLRAHELGLCHRAFSVFIFRNNKKLEVLLQQRAKKKYHCGGLWTNTCCSHPSPNEDTQTAAQNRLAYEMGIEAALTPAGSFHYKAPFKNGLTENEVDHVYYAFVAKDIDIKPNPEEVCDYRWVDIASLSQQLNQPNHDFTPWFGPALQKALTAMQKEA
jgi:isopentenyl-diphosphate delta-isomerase type 1